MGIISALFVTGYLMQLNSEPTKYRLYDSKTMIYNGEIHSLINLIEQKSEILKHEIRF